MASFKYLIFVALVALSVYSAVAEEAPKAEEQVGAEAARVKKHAYIAAPALAYSSPVYPYAYSAYPSAYPYSYSYPAAYPTAYASYPSYAYAHDDGKYWPGKYEAKAYYPAYKSAYPAVYHY
ncbi:adhesive plaque matrix protein-like [Metopolophium dirhodum]|uniref:adhesive plaque matrix protein-like n=1 Tax=Metopolophium dirhodum TaxID=44670 RepID=UPI00298F99F5|nr:adhesive plaque matrix protein-like [Metopolophium dirhodum]